MIDHEKALQRARQTVEAYSTCPALPLVALHRYEDAKALLAYEERDKVLTSIMANVPERLKLVVDGKVLVDGKGNALDTDWLRRTQHHLACVLCNARTALASIKPATKE